MRRRLRRIAKWTGAAVTLTLLAAWVGSNWWGCYGAARPTVEIYVIPGLFCIGWEEPWSPKPANIGGSILALPRNRPLRFCWWFHVEHIDYSKGGAATRVGVPIWFIALLTAVPTLWLWRRDRKLGRMDACANCGYSRIGLPADRPCPECGKPACHQ